jgi:hypothetical protein
MLSPVRFVGLKIKALEPLLAGGVPDQLASVSHRLSVLPFQDWAKTWLAAKTKIVIERLAKVGSDRVIFMVRVGGF